jgi:hypothetical protein
MLTLQNSELRVDILDPVRDAARLGPRFCWGGYIWQVYDSVAGPLFTGPEWPEPSPSAFNGQGLPESFRHRTLEGRPLTWRGEVGVALGAGELRCDGEKVHVVAPCKWEVTATAERIEFRTQHAAAGFQYSLRRVVALAGRQISSVTHLTNASTGQAMALEWFTHPFFALLNGEIRAQLPTGAELPANAGFTLMGRTLTQKRRFTRADDGHMERGLRLLPNQPLSTTLTHPSLTYVQFETSFAPAACVLWGNDRTFSIEPYLTLNLAPGESRDWSLTYGLGAPRDCIRRSGFTPRA